MNKGRKVVVRHAHDHGRHEVQAALNVLVMPSADGGYFAQGIEIDYVATGNTEDEARTRFAEGFVRTVCANLARGRELDGLFKSQTPVDLRKAYYTASRRAVFSCTITQDLSNKFPDNVSVPAVLNFGTLRPIAA